ncbi:hypothetical protein H2203_002162 [Taxawa tesnikishii (nom. ined.)]|nr:hypothetical protein H2203_002162 [Dothideales sp. JES 119]
MPDSSTEPRPTPNIPSGGLFSPYGNATINASASAVYHALIDTSTWPQWNTFVPSATITHQPDQAKGSARMVEGTGLLLHVKMTSSFTTVSKEVVFQVDPPPSPGKVTRVCWHLDNKAILTPRFMLHADRVNEIEDHGDGTCEFRSWETFGGPLAKIVRWKYEKALQERFRDWVTDMKNYVEGKERNDIDDAGSPC